MSSPLRWTTEGEAWVATWGDSCARMVRPAAGYLVVWRCSIAAHDDLSPVVDEILAFVATGERLVVTWETPDRSRLNAELLRRGCIVHREKLFVRRDLRGGLPRTVPFAWRSLAEVGHEAFLPVLWEASQGDPFEGPDRDARREWGTLVADTGSDLDPALWRIALQEGEPLGVVLPTVWKGERREGTMSYVGVLPSHRGRGLGRALHAAGLHLLAEAGALRYVGSTDVRNTAMARVFAQNGCLVEAKQLLLHPPPARQPASR